MDDDGPLDGGTIRVVFFTRLGGERQFPNLDALRDEVLHNAEETRNYFASLRHAAPRA